MLNSNIIFNILCMICTMTVNNLSFCFPIFHKRYSQGYRTFLQNLICSFPYWCIWKAGFCMQFPLLIFMKSRVWYAVCLIDIYGKRGLVCSFSYWYLWKAGFGMQFPLLIFMKSRVLHAVSLIDIYGKQGLVCSFPYWYLWKAGFGMQFPLLIFMKSRVWYAVSLIDIY